MTDYLDKGNTLLKLGRLQEALAAYEQAIQLNSTYASIYIGKGDVLVQLGRIEEALMAYEQATQLEPTDADAYVKQRGVLGVLGRWMEALASFAQAISLDRARPDFYNIPTECATRCCRAKRGLGMQIYRDSSVLHGTEMEDWKREKMGGSKRMEKRLPQAERRICGERTEMDQRVGQAAAQPSEAAKRSGTPNRCMLIVSSIVNPLLNIYAHRHLKPVSAIRVSGVDQPCLVSEKDVGREAIFVLKFFERKRDRV